MEALSSVLFQRVLVVVWTATFGLLVSRIAWRIGFYHLPVDDSIGKLIPDWRHVFQAFLIFLGIQMILVPGLLSFSLYLQPGERPNLEDVKFSPEFYGWANLGAIACVATLLTLFFFSLDKVNRQKIWGKSSSDQESPTFFQLFKQNGYKFLVGCLTWILAYPWIVVIGQLLAILLAYAYAGPFPDQTAVRHLKNILDNPLLLGITAVAVVSVIPFIEELLFRGFLQSWLKTIFGRAKAIVITSIIFALFHFSLSQGVENIEFIASLFVLSCYLGFIKEKQQSLWASIGLHSTFNFVSLSMLLS